MIKLGTQPIVRVACNRDGTRCVAESADNHLYQVNLVNETWNSTRIGAGLARISDWLSEGIRLCALIRAGNLLAKPMPVCQSCAGPELMFEPLRRQPMASGYWPLMLEESSQDGRLRAKA